MAQFLLDEPLESLPISRRTFLRWAGSLGVIATSEALAGCATSLTEAVPTTAPVIPTSPPPTAAAAPSAAATVTLIPSATPTTAPSPTSPATASPIPMAALLDESSLAPAYVAHDPEVTGYPAAPPFDPDTLYAEYPYPDDAPGAQNGCYRLVREALRLFAPLGFDTPEWNPLGSVIRPGDRVLIKPNLVDDSAWKQGQMTHPAFLRPIVDYALKACGPGGQVIIGEGPWAAGVFDRVVDNTGIRAMAEHLAQKHGAPVVLRDLNKASRAETPLVDLGTVSALTLDDRVWLDGHYKRMKPAGDPGIGRYYIAPTVLQADVVINVPKLKVHCSGGITVAMKNMIGIIPAWDGPYEKAQLKDCAHASETDMAQGNLGKYLNNDTIWRSMSDLNRILLYADRQGIIQPGRQRRYLAIVDGIVAAEESQYQPHARPLGTVVIAADPVTCDAVSARVMGFDPRKLRSVTQPERITSHPLGSWRPEGIRLVTSWDGGLNTTYRVALTPELHVYSWAGQVEAVDFDPPGVETIAWNADTGELQVQARDAEGVAYVRVAYELEGRRYQHALALAGGDVKAGRWSVPLPIGQVVKRGELEIGDVLFNQSRLELAW